mmetsp:Transcript_2139/g.14069  ORF Transcript_2139/g.14069 Transcript_2139/m.14069 type:complete len:119 (+) Transcript_2139:1653-2009(+)
MEDLRGNMSRWSHLNAQWSAGSDCLQSSGCSGEEVSSSFPYNGQPQEKNDRIVGSQSYSYDVYAKQTWERCTGTKHWNGWNPQLTDPNTKRVRKAVTASSYHGAELRSMPAVPMPTSA